MSLGLVSTPVFAKVIELTVNDHNPEMAPPGQATKHWAAKVEELSGGKVKVNVHFGGALLKGDEAYRGVQKGVADAAHYTLDKRDGFLLNTIMALPFMGWPSQKETGKMYMDLLEKFSAMKGEWENVKITGVMMMPPTHIHTVDKVIKTPADLKGMKFHGAEAALVKSLDVAGATAVQMDIADMYMSLDRGLLQGVMNHIPVLQVFGVLKLLKYHTMFGDGGMNMTPMFMIMNADKFNSLPPEAQKAVMGAGQAWSEKFLVLDAGFQKKCLSDAQAMNHTFTYLTPEEIKVWYNLIKEPVHDKWIQEAEAKGLPGKAVYDAALKMLEDHKK
jgi:TRAP-type C4-dicarboxylate transport system substrate-binding protein